MPTWPALPLASWRETRDTLHMWTQIAGKICLSLTPRVNHFWNVAFRLAPHGLVTPTLAYQDRTFTMTFDLVDHRFVIESSDGTAETVALEPQTVADFYRHVMDALGRMDIEVKIWTMPVEVPSPVRFEEDFAHASYDDDAAHTFLEVLLAVAPPLERFRAGFIGKCSPVHFFWGSFDLAVTRFSGRPAPERAGADSITREAYSHEVISHGWWPGGGAVDEPAFYAYAAPEPDKFKSAKVRPSAAFYSKDFNEFILPYEAVRSAAAPEEDLNAFLKTTYDAGATLGKWDRKALERQPIKG
jgi:Family of unknown function (DUF5996)